mmetsp:Transcript_53307/g.137842  ORF Transcript_53307/g.137842 Transcript_53307/m.137842 type:complete len:272 (-) Transcript_53307:547-1362(-)
MPLPNMCVTCAHDRPASRRMSAQSLAVIKNIEQSEKLGVTHSIRDPSGMMRGPHVWWPNKREGRCTCHAWSSCASSAACALPHRTNICGSMSVSSSGLEAQELRGALHLPGLVVVAQQSRLDQSLLLSRMHLGIACGWGGRRAAADVAHDQVVVHSLASSRHQAGPDVGPRAHVLGLFLAPDNVAGVQAVTDVNVLVGLQNGLDTIEGEGGDLLHGDDRHILQAQLLALLQEFKVNLARAEDQSVHLVRIRCDLGIPLVYHPFETRTRAQV